MTQRSQLIIKRVYQQKLAYIRQFSEYDKSDMPSLHCIILKQATDHARQIRVKTVEFAAVSMKKPRASAGQDLEGNFANVS